MIKPFVLSDLGSFIPNEFSDPDAILPALVSTKFTVQTMMAPDENVEAIIAYTNYWGDCWDGFVLIGHRFPFPSARRLRDHLKATMVEKNASRFQTISIANDCLRKWHEYLGFTLEGTRKKMMFGRDYDMYAILKEPT